MLRKRVDAPRKSGDRYKVGYRRPPISTRFQPGQSGNPKGRPKGARNNVSMAQDALEQTIRVRTNGTAQIMTVREAAYRRLAERAVGGDLKALQFLLGLENQQDPAGSSQPDADMFSNRALEIVEDFLDRRRHAKGDSHEKNRTR